MPNKNKANIRAIEAKQRHVKALNLRKQGFTYQMIADELGYANAAGAYVAVTTELQAIVREPAEEVRTLELERLDQMLAVLWARAMQGDDKERAIDRILKVMERRAALLGLDAPKRIENSGDSSGPVIVNIGQRNDGPQ